MHVITYTRVSTRKQGDSGLGLEAQERAIDLFVESNSAQVVGQFTEVESGKNCRREQLLKAIEKCQETGTTLVIAKLDRLARNASFTFALMDSGIEFVCCDMPSANRMTIGIMAVMAEHEARMISERTKAGLASAKARGKVLGGARCQSWRESKRPRTRKEMLPQSTLTQILQLRISGASFSHIAQLLNEQGLTTSRGNTWVAKTVQQVHKRIAA